MRISTHWRSVRAARGLLIALAAIGGTSTVAPVATAQPARAWDYRGRGLSRSQLQEMLARYRAAAASVVYSAELRGQARSAADSIEVRLAQGDFQVGDRIFLRIEGQPALPDTFPVTSGLAVIVPGVGPISLRGVLQSELLGQLTASVDAVYRGASVQALALTRLAVIGGIGRPGYHALGPDALIADVITAAGGLSSEARLDRAYIVRGQSELFSPDSLQVATREGRTLEDLGLRSGDQLVVPTQLPSDPQRTLMTLSYLLGLPLTFYTLLHLF